MEWDNRCEFLQLLEFGIYLETDKFVDLVEELR